MSALPSGHVPPCWWTSSVQDSQKRRCPHWRQRYASISASYQTYFSSVVVRGWCCWCCCSVCIILILWRCQVRQSLVSRPRSHRHRRHPNRFVFDQSKLPTTHALKFVQLCACVFRYICIYELCHKLHYCVVHACQICATFSLPSGCSQGVIVGDMLSTGGLFNSKMLRWAPVLDSRHLELRH